MVDLDEGEAADFGPAMGRLSEKQRAFVRAALEFPTAKGEALSRKAGYQNSALGHRVMAHGLLHNNKIIEAMDEETRKRLRFGGFVGVARLVQIAQSPKHKDHFRALEALADRGGFGASMKVDVAVDDRRPKTDAQKRARIVELAAQLGVDVERLMGANAVPAIAGPGPVIEHEA